MRNFDIKLLVRTSHCSRSRNERKYVDLNEKKSKKKSQTMIVCSEVEAKQWE